MQLKQLDVSRGSAVGDLTRREIGPAVGARKIESIGQSINGIKECAFFSKCRLYFDKKQLFHSFLVRL